LWKQRRVKVHRFFGFAGEHQKGCDLLHKFDSSKWSCGAEAPFSNAAGGVRRRFPHQSHEQHYFHSGHQFIRHPSKQERADRLQLLVGEGVEFIVHVVSENILVEPLEETVERNQVEGK
jgi:hypothetical protein